MLNNLFLENKIQTNLNILIRRCLTSWFFMACLLCFYTLYKGDISLHGTDQLNLIPFNFCLLAFMFVFVLYFLIANRIKNEKLERYILLSGFILLSLLSQIITFSLSMLVFQAVLIIVLLVYAIKGSNAPHYEKIVSPVNSKSKKYPIIILSVATVIFMAFVGIWAFCRVKTFVSPTYDYGIFAQMFYYMKETGLPYTTVERDGLLSHFAVHVSPIYYLLLPFYCIFPKVETANVLQALILGSAVVPMYKLCRNHRFTQMQSVGICCAFMLWPAFAGGTGYDIHENEFLVVTILWLFYALEKQNIPGIAISTILLLFVKEDAPVYAAIIGIWYTITALLQKNKIEKRKLIIGISVVIVSVIYFIAVTKYLDTLGDGVMTNRYDNFIYDKSDSLFTVIKAVFMSPAKLLYECSLDKKPMFIIQTLAPLLFLPLITRKYERYILLIPYLLLNLMSFVEYQHSIFYQYVYGSGACLFYLTIVNLEDIKDIKIPKATITFSKLTPVLLSICIISFTATVVTTALPVISDYIENDEKYFSKDREFLNKIPEDASVSASPMCCPTLSQRKVLYDIYYAKDKHILSTEYIVVDCFSDYKKYADDSDKSGYMNFLKLIEEEGYILIDNNEFIKIYQKEQ